MQAGCSNLISKNKKHSKCKKPDGITNKCHILSFVIQLFLISVCPTYSSLCEIMTKSETGVILSQRQATTKPMVHRFVCHLCDRSSGMIVVPNSTLHMQITEFPHRTGQCFSQRIATLVSAYDTTVGVSLFQITNTYICF